MDKDQCIWCKKRGHY
jgi:hypothetical protein